VATPREIGHLGLEGLLQDAFAAPADAFADQAGARPGIAGKEHVEVVVNALGRKYSALHMKCRFALSRLLALVRKQSS
jgi:hypothetical protein